MANSVNYQHLKTLLNAYEKAEIWKSMKKDYPSSDEFRKEVDRKANE